MLARFGRTVLLLSTIAMGFSAPASAQTVPFPSSPLPSNAELNYLVDGAIDLEFTGEPHLIFERFDLELGESVPAEPGPQILISLSGTVETVDDLGLKATLDPLAHLFAPARSIDQLIAASKASLLRARLGGLATDAPKITITEDGCTPEALTVSGGGSIQVVNATLRRQSFYLESGETILDLDPTSSEVLELGGAEPGVLIAQCGLVRRSNTPLTTIAVTVTASAAATPTTSPDHVVLLNVPFEAGDHLVSNMYVAKVTLDGKSSTGEQTFGDVTGIVATSQPLSLVRSGRLPATLPAANSVALPSGSTLAIENSATSATEFFVVGLIAEGIVLAPSPTPTAVVPTPAASTPTPTAVASSVPVNLSDFLPDRTAIARTGFVLLETNVVSDYDDSLLNTFVSTPTEAGWITSQETIYGNTQDDTTVTIIIDSFRSSDAATAMIEEIDQDTTSWGMNASPPEAENASTVVAFVVNLTNAQRTGTQITGQFGPFLVSVLVFTPIYADGMPTALDFWEIVDAAQD